MTWKQGVDIVSFGATKSGCLMAEAIVVFDERLAGSLNHRRQRAGQTISKGRLIAAQFEGYFADDHWIANARHANRMARLLADGLTELPGVRLGWPAHANEVFPILPRRLDRALQAGGVRYHPWSSASLPERERIEPDEVLIRLVTSFATKEHDVQKVLAVARAATRGDARA
jgi:threonine aldolase